LRHSRHPQQPRLHVSIWPLRDAAVDTLYKYKQLRVNLLVCPQRPPSTRKTFNLEITNDCPLMVSYFLATCTKTDKLMCGSPLWALLLPGYTYIHLSVEAIDAQLLTPSRTSSKVSSSPSMRCQVYMIVSRPCTSLNVLFALYV
jgi:hypothetical protein